VSLKNFVIGIHKFDHIVNNLAKGRIRCSYKFCKCRKYEDYDVMKLVKKDLHIGKIIVEIFLQFLHCVRSMNHIALQTI